MKDSDMVGSSLCLFVSGMKCWCCSLDDEAKQLVNFVTTAMVAIVSGISNEGKGMLLATPESELRQWFKGNYYFVIAQVDSELENPIHEVLLSSVSGKRGIICESVCLEFKEFISMCGGPNEKLRAEYFLKFLKTNGGTWLLIMDKDIQITVQLPKQKHQSLLLCHWKFKKILMFLVQRRRPVIILRGPHVILRMS